MRVFGTKHIEPTDEDRVAAARLSAVAARFKAEPASDFTEVGPDPIGAPESSADDTPEDEIGSDED
jgi:hypothetical protein